MSWAAIAAEMGISECRVRQLYGRAMEKIRRVVREDPSLRSVLEEYDVEYEPSWNEQEGRQDRREGPPRPQAQEARDTGRPVRRRTKARQGGD